VGIYYNPPNPHIGAAQPLEPKKLVPPSGPPPQNPPFPGAAALALSTVMAVAWTPPPPLPPAAVNLDPALTVSTPPVNGGAQIPAAVLVAWRPPPPDPFMGMGGGNLEPLTATKLLPSGPTPQNPPFPGPITGLPLPVQVAWIPPPPDAFIGASGPLIPERTVPPISGPPPQNPPFAGGAQTPEPVLIAWLPPDPMFQRGPFVPASAIANYPPPGNGAAVPGAVLTSWLPPPYLAQTTPPPPPPAPVPPSYVTVGTVIPQAVLNAYDWAPRWPWATPPVVTPSGPAPQNPPFPGAKVGIDVQVSWLPPAPQPVVGPQLVWAAAPNPVPAPLSGPLAPPAAVMVWWSIPAPPQPPQAPIQAFQTPPPVTGPLTVPYPVRAWWDLPPPMPPAARNLDPPIPGPVPQNPPFMGGARVPLAVLVDWIPPPPQPPVAWTATQVFLPPPGANLRYDPRFLTIGVGRRPVTTPQARYAVTYSAVRTTLTRPKS
jgi:hypothetical protein